MEIEFELQDKKTIKIFGITNNGERKEIGCILTPASSGENVLNAIQVCGISEVYDYWGCSRYSKNLDVNDALLHEIQRPEEEQPLIQTKDIQMIFSETNVKSKSFWSYWSCDKCFNRNSRKLGVVSSLPSVGCPCEKNKDYFKIFREHELLEKGLLQYKED